MNLVMIMQMNRLLNIVEILLKKKTVTAKELAKHFKVSTRTIYRDIAVLSKAGIPVYMSQGKGGGISLGDYYAIDQSIQPDQDKNEIITVLEELKALKNPDIEQALAKLSLLFQNSTLASFQSNRNHVNLILQVDKSQYKRVYEEFRDCPIVECKDYYTVTVSYPEDEKMYRLILSYGDYVKVVEPEHIRINLEQKLRNALRKYE